MVGDEFTYDQAGQNITDLTTLTIPNRTTYVKLGYNNIVNLPPHYFKNLSALDLLELDHNSIEILMSNAFTGLHALYGLYLDSNDIYSAQSGCFSDLWNLEELWLNDNALIRLPETVFNLTNHPSNRLPYHTTTHC